MNKKLMEELADLRKELSVPLKEVKRLWTLICAVEEDFGVIDDTSGGKLNPNRFLVIVADD